MKVAVVIPMYNRRWCIRRAVDSVLAQTHVDFELIVVDDGSTDGGGDLVRECGDARVCVVDQPNAGECAARNRGIAEARAEWVAFLDSDDEWLPQFLERVVAMASLHPALGAVFTNLRTYAPPKPCAHLRFTEPRVIYNYFDFLLENPGSGMSSSSVMIRKEIIEGIGGFPVGIHRSGDIDTWLRVALAAPMGCVPEVQAIFHNETAGSRTQFPEPYFPEAVKTIRRLRAEGRIPDQLAATLLRLENQYLLTYARDLLRYGTRRRAARVLFRECSLRYCSPVRFLRMVARLVTPPRKDG